MSYRDDFNSSMSSPNNYGKNTTYGNSGYKGGYGGTNNAGGGGYTTIAQKNFARSGGSFGRGFGFGSLNNPNNGLSRGSPVRRGGLLGDEFVQVGPVPNVQGPVPTSLPPPVTQEDIPGPMPQPDPVAPYRDYPVPPIYVQPTRPMAPNVYGQPPAPPIGDRPPPAIYGPRTGTAAYNMDRNPVVPQGSQMGYNNLRSTTGMNNYGGWRDMGFN